MKNSYLDSHIGCFGNFDIEDLICRRFCALRLRCVIKRDENIETELFEDLISFDNMTIKIQ